jgi:predicted acylesterase/phospholipase RssA
MRQADVLLAVADIASDPQECAQTFESVSRGIASSISTTLVLLHGKEAGSQDRIAITRKTAAWKRILGVSTHEHVRLNNPADVGRLARALNRQSVGLVLGGGFALGLAHIGVIDAMRHLQIPIDFVGGTSMGAIIGVACAMEFSHAQMLEVMDKGCVQALKGDYTFPIVSLLTGKKVGLALGEYLEGLDIEDLWLPYFAISASLVHARMVVHREGSALRSVLASCRAPGMFPPLGWEGDVLVDGGLVNNNPADVMRECVGSGTVFASAVSPGHEFKAGADFGMELSGWRVAARKVNPFRSGERVGTIGDVLMRMIRLGGVAHDKEIQSRADLYLSLPLHDFSFRDFHRGEELAKVGFDFAVKTLEAWIAENGRPWLGQAGRAPELKQNQVS